MKKIRLLNAIIFFLAILISIPAILPYFHAGYFPTHDGEWAVVRLGEMFRELRDFQFPARYSTTLNFGYGYPLFNFAYPLPYYLGIFLYLFKFGFVGSIKILFAASVIFSSLFMFLASKQLWKNSWAGLISAILYVYLPYRMVDLYVRGSIGESLSFAFFPLIVFFIVKIINNPSSKLFIIFTSFFYAALILTHNIMAVLFSLFLFLLVFVLAVLGGRKALKSILISVIFGFLLSAFFWLPALFEKQYILLSKVPIADRNLYFVNFKQLLFSSWGHGVPIDNNGFSYSLGIPHLIILFLTVVLFWFLWRKKINSENLSVKYTFALILISIILMFFLFPVSSFLWKLPLLAEINYPWTMLAPIGFLISLTAGFLSTKGMKMTFISLFLAVISIILVLPNARPQNYIDRGDNYYLTNDATTTSSSEYTPLWVKTRPMQKPIEQIEIISGSGGIKNVIYKSNKISYKTDAQEDLKVRVNTIYYPGWKAFIDEKETKIQYNNEQGVMDTSIIKGNHNIKLIFSETPLRLSADLISIFSFIILAIFYLRFKYETN